ncbi:MAG TPA: hypothetical protein PKD68_03015 [Candidatus Saccharibacteria bacterium]|nr:hypothetical protein [Candidatus Saccharibacteria bacterium]
MSYVEQLHQKVQESEYSLLAPAFVTHLQKVAHALNTYYWVIPGSNKRGFEAEIKACAYQWLAEHDVAYEAAHEILN